MDLSFFSVFDVIVFILGAYLTFSGIKNTKEGTLDSLIVSAEEIMKCSDVAAFSKYIMPKTMIFGLFCMLFSAQGLCNDMGWIEFSKTVNSIFLIGFLVAWMIFSYFIRKGKQTYIH